MPDNTGAVDNKNGGGQQFDPKVLEAVQTQLEKMNKKVEQLDGKVKVHRELEGGLMEVVEVDLPAVLTIQTGINEPRYAPIRGIREAQKKELKVASLDDLGIDPDSVNADASMVVLEQLYIPEVESSAEFIEGEADEKAEKLASILVKGGLV